jgi:hypothetical protein
VWSSVAGPVRLTAKRRVIAEAGELLPRRRQLVAVP